jgi:hypothetical protein
MESIGLAGMTICSSESDRDSDGDDKANTRPLRRRRGRVVRVKCEALRRRKDRDSRRRDAAAAAAAAEEISAEEEFKEENQIPFFRQLWEGGGYFGSFDDETSISGHGQPGPTRPEKWPGPGRAWAANIGPIA